jgi:hypothetical protein
LEGRKDISHILMRGILDPSHFEGIHIKKWNEIWGSIPPLSFRKTPKQGNGEFPP